MFGILANKSSGVLNRADDFRQFAESLERMASPWTYYISNSLEDAKTRIDEWMSAGIKGIVLAGGDGTVHFAVNHIMHHWNHRLTDFWLSVIPMGTGNDWSRNFRFSDDLSSLDRLVEEGIELKTAIPRIHYHDDAGQKNVRYFINIAGAGFDAQVVETMERNPGMKTSGASYFLALGKTFFKRKARPFDLIIDGNPYHFRGLSCLVGRGTHLGAGMHLMPHGMDADPLAFTLLGDIGLFDFLMNLGKLYNGHILSHPKVNSGFCEEIVIDSEERSQIKVEVDGELLCTLPVRISMSSHKIRLKVLPKP